MGSGPSPSVSTPDDVDKISRCRLLSGRDEEWQYQVISAAPSPSDQAEDSERSGQSQHAGRNQSSSTSDSEPGRNEDGPPPESDLFGTQYPSSDEDEQAMVQLATTGPVPWSNVRWDRPRQRRIFTFLFSPTGRMERYVAWVTRQVSTQQAALTQGDMVAMLMDEIASLAEFTIFHEIVTEQSRRGDSGWRYRLMPAPRARMPVPLVRQFLEQFCGDPRFWSFLEFHVSLYDVTDVQDRDVQPGSRTASLFNVHQGHFIGSMEVYIDRVYRVHQVASPLLTSSSSSSSSSTAAPSHMRPRPPPSAVPSRMPHRPAPTRFTPWQTHESSGGGFRAGNLFAHHHGFSGEL